MRHGRVGRHLKRSSGHRRALYRTLMTELFRHEQIRTTEAKAKAIRPLAERLVTTARKGRAERVSNWPNSAISNDCRPGLTRSGQSSLSTVWTRATTKHWNGWPVALPYMPAARCSPP